MRRIIRRIPLLLLFLLARDLPAANISYNSGTAGFAFLKMPVGVRAQGLGENFTAVGDDASTIFYNPAGLLKIKGVEISAEHILWFEQISKSNVNFVYPSTIIGPIGIGLNYISVPYEKRSAEDDVNYQSANVWMGVFQIALAREIKENFLLGAAIKYISENLEVKSTNGIALDIGGIYELQNMISLGVSIQNLGTQFTNDNSDNLPSLIRAGASKRFLNVKLILASDLVYGFVDGSSSFGIGAEYVLSRYFYPRFGYKYRITNNNMDLISGVNVGFGIRYQKLGFDYSFSPRADLGMVHLISFSGRF